MKTISKSACIGYPAQAASSSIYTPSILLRRIADALQLNTNGAPLYLRGIFEEKSDKNYNGIYYAYLCDPAGDKRLTITLPVALYTQLRPGQSIEVSGYIQPRWEKDDALEIQFRVENLTAPPNVQSIEDAATADHQARLALLTEQARRRRPPLATLLLPKLQRGAKPVLKCIYGRTNEVAADVLSALHEAADAYLLIDEHINITAKADLLQALAQVENSTAYDAVIIIRGGGASLDLLDDLDIARAALRLKPHLVTAVGHAQHTPLLEQMADTAFATPTDLGHTLRVFANLTHPQRAPAPSPMLDTAELVRQLTAALLPALQAAQTANLHPAPSRAQATPDQAAHHAPSLPPRRPIAHPADPQPAPDATPAHFALLTQAIPAHFRLQAITAPAPRPALARFASFLALLAP